MITIGFSTRKIDDGFIELLKKSCGVPNPQIIPIENEGKYSLPEAYNMILEQSTNDIVVLCHDDIYFDSKNWGTKILKHFKRNTDYGILGLAGSTQLPSSAKWWEDFSKMKGIVNHEHGGKKWESKYSESLGNQIENVVLVDGLLIALNKKNIKEKFNENIKGFHFYDVDFSFRNFIRGVKIGVMYDVRVTHKSIGATNDQWEQNRIIFAENNKENLPLKVKMDLDKNSRLKVLIYTKNYESSKPLLDILNQTKYNVSFCGILDQKTINHFKGKSINLYPITEPNGFKIGDGKWGSNTPNGFVLAEPNKLYKIKEIYYDIIHVFDDVSKKEATNLYPLCNVMYGESKFENVGDLINCYNKIING